MAGERGENVLGCRPQKKQNSLLSWRINAKSHHRRVLLQALCKAWGTHTAWVGTGSAFRSLFFHRCVPRLPSGEVRPEEEVMGRKRPRSHLGPALTVSLAAGKEALDSTFVSLPSPLTAAGSSEVSRGARDRDMQVARRGTTGPSPLPTSPRREPDVLFELRLPSWGLCLPPRCL